MKSSISAIRHLCGATSIFLLSAIAFYAWPYRNILGLGKSQLYEVTSLEKLATVTVVIGFFIWFYSLVAVTDYSSNTQRDKIGYLGDLKSELRKNGIK